MIRPRELLALNFCAGGNGAAHLGDGWFDPEPSGTWGRGGLSVLNLPAIPEGAECRLVLDLVAFVEPPRLPRQSLQIWLGGTQITAIAIAEADLKRVQCTIPRGLASAAGNTLMLVHPDGRAPAEVTHDNNDVRRLSIRLIGLHLETMAVDLPQRGRRAALLTMAYNEAINLPIWLRHHARAAPAADLYVVDHGSDDGSTDDLGGATRLRLPRRDHDERRRTDFINDLQRNLLRFYDIVAYTDCDELMVADPRHHADLAAYFDCLADGPVSAVGLNLVQAGDETPLDPARPILRQRRFVQFSTALCKPVLTTAPITWDVGFHCCDRPIRLDPSLFLLHLKSFDRAISLRRHRLNRDLAWSEASLAHGLSVHQRFADDLFLDAFFADVQASVARGDVAPFDFAEDIAACLAAACFDGTFHRLGNLRGRVAVLPDAMRDIL